MKSAFQLLSEIRAPEMTTECPPCALFADDVVATTRAYFGLDGSRGPKLDPIHARLASWATGGADNTRRVGDVLYSWTAHPRLQQNGAGLGRVYAQRRGESPVDIGGYKIDKDGNVLEFPGGAVRGAFGIWEAS